MKLLFSELQTCKTAPRFTAGYGLKDLSALKPIFIIQCYTQKVLLEKKKQKQTNKRKKEKLQTETVLGKMTEKRLRTSQ